MSNEEESTSYSQPESKNRKTTVDEDDSRAHRHGQRASETCSDSCRETDSTAQPTGMYSPDDGASEAPTDSVDPDSGFPVSDHNSSAASQHSSDSQQVVLSLLAVSERTITRAADGLQSECDMHSTSMANTGSMVAPRYRGEHASFSRTAVRRRPPAPTATVQNWGPQPLLTAFDGDRAQTAKYSHIDACIRTIDLSDQSADIDMRRRLRFFKKINDVFYKEREHIVEYLLTSPDSVEALKKFERKNQLQDDSYLSNGLKWWLEWALTPTSTDLCSALIFAQCSPPAIYKIFQV